METNDIFSEATIGEVRIAIGRWCATMRRARKQDQGNLAEKIGVSRATVSGLERGGNFTIDTLLKILRYFGEMDSLHGFVLDRAENSKTIDLYRTPPCP